jgi:hypothetical protein
MSQDISGAGLRVRLEQTTAWAEATASVPALEGALSVAREVPDGHLERLARARRVIVSGAGSSHYVSQIAASSAGLGIRRCGALESSRPRRS